MSLTKKLHHKIKERFNSNLKRGAMVTMSAIVIAMLYPVVQFTIMDIGTTFVLREQVKTQADIAITSMLSEIDYEAIHTGNERFRNDAIEKAQWVMQQKFGDHTFNYVTNIEKNLQTGVGRIDNVLGGTLHYYVEIYSPVVTNYIDYHPIIIPTFNIGGEKIHHPVIPDDYAHIRNLLSWDVPEIQPTILVVVTYDFNTNFISMISGNNNRLTIIQYATKALNAADYFDFY
jgi:hypothetical protein